MNFAALRRRNKQVLVDHAFNVFLPMEKEANTIKERWIERLLDGYDVNRFIQELKEGRAATPNVTNSLDLPEGTIGRIQVVDENLELHAGLKRKMRVQISNLQANAFQTTPEEPVFAAYHWFRANGEVYEFDGARTPLPSPVKPGQQLEMSVNLTPPAEPGDYQLMVTMVYEGHCWMEEKGLEVQQVAITVQDYDGRGLTRHALSVFKQLQAAEIEVIH